MSPRSILLVDPKTGAEKFFLQDEIPGALSKGWKARPGDQVLLQDFWGDPTSATADTVGEKLRGGATPEPESSIDRRFHRQEMERKYGGGAINTIKALGYSVARGATLGTIDPVLSAIVGSEELREIARTHGTISTVGELSGAILPILLSGGAAAPATGARASLRYLPSAMAGRAGARVSAKLGGGVVGMAGGAALETGLFGAGSGITKTTLSEDPVTPEALISNMSSGALYGGGYGALFGAGFGMLAKGHGAIQAVRARKAQARVDAIDDAFAGLSAEQRAQARGRIAENIERANAKVAKAEETVRSAQAKLSAAETAAEQRAARLALKDAQAAQRAADKAAKDAARKAKKVGRAHSETDDLGLGLSMSALDKQGQMLRAQAKLTGDAIGGSRPLRDAIDDLARTQSEIDGLFFRFGTNGKREISDLSHTRLQKLHATEPARYDEMIDAVRRYEQAQLKVQGELARINEGMGGGLSGGASSRLQEMTETGRQGRPGAPDVTVDHPAEILKSARTVTATPPPLITKAPAPPTPVESAASRVRALDAKATADKLAGLRANVGAAESGLLEATAARHKSAANILEEVKAMERIQGEFSTMEKLAFLNEVSEGVTGMSAEDMGGIGKVFDLYLKAHILNRMTGGKGLPGGRIVAAGVTANRIRKAFSGKPGKGGAIRGQAESSLGKVANGIMKGTDSLIRAGRRVTPVVAGSILSKVSYSGEPNKVGRPDADRAKLTTTQRAFLDRAAEIKDAVANIDRTAQRINASLKDFAALDQTLGMQALSVAIRKVAYLASKLPNGPEHGGIGRGQEYLPSDMEISKFARIVAAVENPVGIMRNMASLSLTIDEAQAVKAVYPEIYRQIQASILDAMAKSNTRMPFDKMVQLSILWDMPVHSAMRTDFQSRLRYTFTQSEHQKPQPQMANLKNKAESAQTTIQRMAQK